MWTLSLYHQHNTVHYKQETLIIVRHDKKALKGCFCYVIIQQTLFTLKPFDFILKRMKVNDKPPCLLTRMLKICLQLIILYCCMLTRKLLWAYEKCPVTTGGHIKTIQISPVCAHIHASNLCLRACVCVARPRGDKIIKHDIKGTRRAPSRNEKATI